MQKDNARKLIITSNNAGNTVLVAGGQLGAGLGSIRVWQVEFVSSAVVSYQFLSAVPPANTTTTPASGLITLSGAGASVVLQATGVPWAECLPGQSLVLSATVANSIVGEIWYTLA